MAYSSGGLIQAADFNGLATTNTSNVAFVWGTGSAQYGYGQSTTALSTLSAGTTVTAAQWSGFLNTINSSLQHQGSASIGPLNYTTGQTVTYFANVGTSIASINTNANVFATQGTVVTGTNFVNYANTATATAYGPAYVLTRTVTFANGDAARYFFNAGGQLNFVIPSVAVLTADTRGTDAQTLLQTNLAGFSAFRNYSGGGRTGTGGTLGTNATAIGYRQQTTAYQTLVSITSATASYTTDTCNLVVRSNGPVGTNQDLGSIITFSVGLSMPAHAGFNDALAVGINNRIDIVPPETTYLTNSWGTITVA